MYHQPESEQELALPATCYLAGRRAGGPLWPVGCPMPAGGSAVKGRQRGRWLPVAERAGPLTALQAAGTQPGAKRRAQIRTAAYRGTPMPRCQGGCHLAGTSLKSSTNTSLVDRRGPGAQEKTCRDICRSFVLLWKDEVLIEEGTTQEWKVTERRRRLSARRHGWSPPTARRGLRGPCGRMRRPVCRWDGAGRERR